MSFSYSYLLFIVFSFSSIWAAKLEPFFVIAKKCCDFFVFFLDFSAKQPIFVAVFRRAINY